MGVSESSIMSKLNAYKDSDAGKKKIAAKLESYRNGSNSRVNSTGKTHGGGKIVTKQQMKHAAKELISLLRSTAASCGVPASVMEHIENFDHTDPFVLPSGESEIWIYLTDKVSRPSLYPDKYPDGVENIVAHLNTGYGYNSKGSVYGQWHGRQVKSLQQREGLWFMQKAVDEFNSKYGKQFNVTVELSPEYNGAFNDN